MKGNMPKFKEHQCDKDFETLRDKISDLLDDTEMKMEELISNYNTKYEDEDGLEAAWYVNFGYGHVSWDGIGFDSYVRPVRSVK